MTVNELIAELQEYIAQDTRVGDFVVKVVRRSDPTSEEHDVEPPTYLDAIDPLGKAVAYIIIA